MLPKQEMASKGNSKTTSYKTFSQPYAPDCTVKGEGEGRKTSVLGKVGKINVRMIFNGHSCNMAADL